MHLFSVGRGKGKIHVESRIMSPASTKDVHVPTSRICEYGLLYHTHTKRDANHANAIFKIYPEYISHCFHLGHVTLVSLQDRCRQTTEQLIRLSEHANQVLSKFSNGFPSLPTFIKHFCHIYFASL